MKTTFRLPSGINECFIRNSIRHHQQQQQHLKNINQQQQNVKQESVSKYTQEKTCAEVSF